jgi:hypothetical protein
MVTLKFKHDNKNYTVKGEWVKNAFSAQAWHGKNECSSIFSIEKTTPKDSELADDDALATAVMEAVKAEVIKGGEF